MRAELYCPIGIATIIASMMYAWRYFLGAPGSKHPMAYLDLRVTLTGQSGKIRALTHKTWKTKPSNA